MRGHKMLFTSSCHGSRAATRTCRRAKFSPPQERRRARNCRKYTRPTSSIGARSSSFVWYSPGSPRLPPDDLAVRESIVYLRCLVCQRIGPRRRKLGGNYYSYPRCTVQDDDRFTMCRMSQFASYDSRRPGKLELDRIL